ncbi:hypothetical protein C8J56DRAFT_122533 [Mycena floridula]|nr:hypothetical protein C8J56DRAFT_122533 [Mycena floridula]
MRTSAFAIISLMAVVMVSAVPRHGTSSGLVARKVDAAQQQREVQRLQQLEKEKKGLEAKAKTEARVLGQDEAQGKTRAAQGMMTQLNGVTQKIKEKQAAEKALVGKLERGQRRRRSADTEVLEARNQVLEARDRLLEARDLWFDLLDELE